MLAPSSVWDFQRRSSRLYVRHKPKSTRSRRFSALGSLTPPMSGIRMGHPGTAARIHTFGALLWKDPPGATEEHDPGHSPILERAMKRLGVDVGGTFTDLIYIDDEGGNILIHKLASTPDDPSRGTIQG